jgi:glycosyltransferase involved in cell wall biosynthesis
MVAAGHRVHASAPGLVGQVAQRVAAMGVTPHDVPLARTGVDPRKDFRYRSVLRDLISRHQVDLVLGYTIKPCVWGSLAAKDCGVESVSLVTGLGYAFIPSRRLRQRLVSAISRHLWRRATAANRVVIFQNPDDRDDFLKAGVLVDPSKARLIDGSGVDMGEYPRQPLPGAARFLMIARLLGNKGVREYAQAAMDLRRHGIAASFSLIGYHDEGPDGIAAGELDLWRAGGLEYLGPSDDVRRALGDCSVFVLPSYREGTPRTVLEAMATGRPVITSDVPGCRETIVDGESGLLVPAREPKALAGAMNRMAGNPALRKWMGAAAWQRCAAKYEVTKVNSVMMRHLEITDMVAPSSTNEVVDDGDPLFEHR